MSGHSKWHSIKHKKGAADTARGKLFAKLIRQIEVAARDGRRRPRRQRRRCARWSRRRATTSVPIDTIERAIKRGTGELEGVTYEQVTYEGYAPGGVAVIVEALTDNRNRTGGRDQERLQPQRRLDRRAGRGGVAVRAQGRRRSSTSAGRRGRAHARRRSTPAPRTSPTRATRGRSPRRRPTCTRCAPRSRRPASRSTSADLTMLPTTSVALDTGRARPSRCCG